MKTTIKKYPFFSRSIPSSLFETKEFDRIIGNIATFHHPKGKEQGAFELKVTLQRFVQNTIIASFKENQFLR
jgi:hypothetical protein